MEDHVISGVIDKLREAQIDVVTDSGDDFDLNLPDDPEIVEALKAKLAEYEARMEGQEYEHPELKALRNPDAVHKHEVFSRLVNDGTINGRTLARDLMEKLGEGFSSRHFIRACVILADYAMTGGAHTFGGTGFGKNRVSKDAS